VSGVSLEEGYGVWRDEAYAKYQGVFSYPVPYIPVVGLVAVYTTFEHRAERLTSYAWRQSVLASETALEGLRASLSTMFRDQLDDTFEVPFREYEPEPGAAGQHLHAHASITDGAPFVMLTMPGREYHLARDLGYASHDYTLTFAPLRLTGDGRGAMANHYPITTEFLEEQSENLRH
jgi:hypothetical protein